MVKAVKAWQQVHLVPNDRECECTDTGVEIEIDGQPGTLVDIVIDDALDQTVEIGDAGTELVEIDQEPGETNDIEVRIGDDVIAEGEYSCVEALSSPGEPNDGFTRTACSGVSRPPAGRSG